MGDSDIVTLGDLSGLTDPSRPAATASPRPTPGSDEERTALIEALADTQENITLTAQELGVSRVTLYRMLRRHAISLTRGLKAPPVAG
jgi:transcriptional regulator of acetoin/glycerol metabolism